MAAWCCEAGGGPARLRPRAHPCPSSAPDQNMIMAALSKHANVKIFSEKLLLLLNRGGEHPGTCAGPLGCPVPPPPPPPS